MTQNKGGYTGPLTSKKGDIPKMMAGGPSIVQDLPRGVIHRGEGGGTIFCG